MALQRIGEILESEAGRHIKLEGKYIDDYVLGDMTSTVYPVNGGMEDWGYAAGWDFGDDATILDCKPETYVLNNVLQSKEAYAHIRSAVYLIETSNSKIPNESFLGGRSSYRHSNGQLLIQGDSITSIGLDGYDGYINRNIRLSLAIIDASKPYILITGVVPLNEEGTLFEVEWKVNGCF
mmetsp:Transcript_34259/g.25327  ORF Transcript_34259/g.25327 Transcript_34259/m.25327 type:complete len:180 (-) Transcript_34259:927-1466(-)